ncbi:MAG: class I SAM-dependent methyltransferase [bacterium]
MGRIKLLCSTRFLVRRCITHFIQHETANLEFDCAVDIGVGKAPYKKFIKAKEYIGIDVEDREGIKNVIITDINNGIPLDNNYADFVLITEVLEHIKEPQKVLSEIYRISKPGGKIIMTVPYAWPIHEAPNDYFRYTEFALRYLLENCGFDKIKITPSNNFFYTVCALINFNLRGKIFVPLVFVLNALGLSTRNFGGNSFPLTYLVSARHPKND